jgi:hypothetical protein
LEVRNFPIRKKLDEDGEVLEEEDEKERFKTYWAGDHLMIPFQCKLYQFRNILLWNLDCCNVNNLEILDTMRRANLDVFWSRQTSTVGTNLERAHGNVLWSSLNHSPLGALASSG